LASSNHDEVQCHTIANTNATDELKANFTVDGIPNTIARNVRKWKRSSPIDHQPLSSLVVQATLGVCDFKSCLSLN
jgi:hypothetical protein